MQEAVDWHRTLVSAMQYISGRGWTSGRVARTGGAMDKGRTSVWRVWSERKRWRSGAFVLTRRVGMRLKGRG